MNYAEGGTGTVGSYSASDPGGGSITWSLPNTTFETDRGDFDISSSGVLTFENTPDYEDPDDHNDDNVYKVTVRASDGSLSASRNVTITVTNRSPTITSGSSSVSYGEGGTGTVGSYSASDPGGGSITWSLPNTTFEADRSDFDISSSGVLTFENTPDYEDPDDHNDDNVYKVTVRASDGSLTASRNVTVTVTDVDESPPDKVTGLTGTPGPNHGEISVTWSAADGADGYQVRQKKRRPVLPDTWIELPADGFGVSITGTTAVVSNLAPGKKHVYQVRGTNANGEGAWSNSSAEIAVRDERPAKVTGLTGTPGPNHGEISLAWSAADGATGYQVRQKKHRTLLPDTWIELPGEGFGVAIRGTGAVVSNLDPDKEYVYQVRGTNVHGEGAGSDSSAEIAVRDERPAIPTGLVTRDMIGGRGVTLEWNPVMGADEYQVETSFSGGSTTADTSAEAISFIGLTPGATYSFKVRACKKQGMSCLYSPWSTTVDREAPEPTQLGHQEDHTVEYEEGTITPAPGLPSGVPDPATVIRGAINDAVADWNAAAATIAGKNLKICKAGSCGISNHDGGTITVQTESGPNPGLNESCGNSTACTKDSPSPPGRAYSGHSPHLRGARVGVQGSQF